MSRLNLEGSRISGAIFEGPIKYNTLSLGDANATLTTGSGPVVIMTHTASRDITLPVVTPDMKGMMYIITAAAAFPIVVKNAAGTTISTVPASGSQTIVCTGQPPSAAGWTGG